MNTFIAFLPTLSCMNDVITDANYIHNIHKQPTYLSFKDTLFAAQPYMHNNREMAFNYTEVLVYCYFTCRGKILQLVKDTAHGNKELFSTKMIVNTCTNFVPFERQRSWRLRKRNFCSCDCSRLFPYIETHIGHGMCLKNWSYELNENVHTIQCESLLTL